MATKKDMDLVEHLIGRTAKGEIKWETTAGPDEYAASFTGKYTIVLSTSINVHTREVYFRMKMKDQEGRTLLVMDSDDDYSRVADLYRAVARASLNVDAAIDEIIGGNPTS